jgi:hypothetical protein
MKYFKLQSFWADDCTFPDAFDTGTVISVDVDDLDKAYDMAIKEALKNIKPQIKPYIEKIESMDGSVCLDWYATPSKNKTGYHEFVEISEATQEEFDAQDTQLFLK